MLQIHLDEITENLSIIEAHRRQHARWKKLFLSRTSWQQAPFVLSDDSNEHGHCETHRLAFSNDDLRSPYVSRNTAKVLNRQQTRAEKQIPIILSKILKADAI